MSVISPVDESGLDDVVAVRATGSRLDLERDVRVQRRVGLGQRRGAGLRGLGVVDQVGQRHLLGGGARRSPRPTGRRMPAPMAPRSATRRRTRRSTRPTSSALAMVSAPSRLIGSDPWLLLEDRRAGSARHPRGAVGPWPIRSRRGRHDGATISRRVDSRCPVLGRPCGARADRDRCPAGDAGDSVARAHPERGPEPSREVRGIGPADLHPDGGDRQVRRPQHARPPARHAVGRGSASAGSPTDRANVRARWNRPTKSRLLSSSSVHGKARSRVMSSIATVTTSDGVAAWPSPSRACGGIRRGHDVEREQQVGELRRPGRGLAGPDRLQRLDDPSDRRRVERHHDDGRPGAAPVVASGSKSGPRSGSRGGPHELGVDELRAEQAVVDVHLVALAVLVRDAGRHEDRRARADRARSDRSSHGGRGRTRRSPARSSRGRATGSSGSGAPGRSRRSTPERCGSWLEPGACALPPCGGPALWPSGSPPRAGSSSWDRWAIVPTGPIVVEVLEGQARRRSVVRGFLQRPTRPRRPVRRRRHPR